MGSSLAGTEKLHTDVTLIEHGDAVHALRPEEVALLQREFATQLGLIPTTATGEYLLQPKEYVGFIALPTGRVLEIRPKVLVGVLFAMLAKVHGLEPFRAEDIPYSSVGELLEFIVAQFVFMVEEIVSRGILQSFEPCVDDLMAIRGKILLAETLRGHPVLRDRHWCAFTEFTPDIVENRILKLACSLLQPFPFRRLPDLAIRLRRLLRILTPVAIDRSASDRFGLIVYHRLNEHYRPVLALARLLLNCLSPSGALGQNQFLAFLVNMNLLFERYVTVALQEKSLVSSLRVASQDGQPLDMKRAIRIIPDVVFYRDGRPCLILDAKYKRGEHNADIFQALAYAHALSVRRVILAYPKSEWQGGLRHRIRPDAHIEILPCYIDLSGGIDDLKQQTEEFAQQVWEEL